MSRAMHLRDVKTRKLRRTIAQLKCSALAFGGRVTGSGKLSIRYIGWGWGEGQLRWGS